METAVFYAFLEEEEGGEGVKSHPAMLVSSITAPRTSVIHVLSQ